MAFARAALEIFPRTMPPQRTAEDVHGRDNTIREPMLKLLPPNHPSRNPSRFRASCLAGEIRFRTASTVAASQKSPP